MYPLGAPQSLNSRSGKSRSIPGQKGRMGRVNVGAARHDKLNRPCHSRSSAYWSALTLGKWSRFHLPPYSLEVTAIIYCHTLTWSLLTKTADSRNFSRIMQISINTMTINVKFHRFWFPLFFFFFLENLNLKKFQK